MGIGWQSEGESKANSWEASATRRQARFGSNAERGTSCGQGRKGRQRSRAHVIAVPNVRGWERAGHNFKFRHLLTAVDHRRRSRPYRCVSMDDSTSRSRTKRLAFAVRKDEPGKVEQPVHRMGAVHRKYCWERLRKRATENSRQGHLRWQPQAILLAQPHLT